MKSPPLLPLVLALAGLFALPAQAQNLVQVYDMARGYDAAYQAAQAQYDSDLYRAAQAKAGLLPFVGLSAGVSRTDFESTVGPSTTNRNFARRMGAPGPVYLVSPAVAAASAVTGVLTDPGTLARR